MAVRTTKPRKTSIEKLIYIYIYRRNFANDLRCSPSLMAPQVNHSITYESGVEFQIELK